MPLMSKWHLPVGVSPSVQQTRNAEKRALGSWGSIRGYQNVSPPSSGPGELNLSAD